MKKLLTSLIVLLALSGVEAQQVAPDLVIAITVDQLRSDYLEYFINTYGEDGFKRLIKNGLYYNRLSFDFDLPNAASAQATIHTGSFPEYHGITKVAKYDQQLKKDVSIFVDNDFMGNYTPGRFSPKALLAHTIADELKIASNDAAQVFAIAPEAEQALSASGKLGDGAFWIDDYNGKWATTTYFKKLPWWVEKYNNGGQSLSKRISQLEWTPIHPIDEFNAFPFIEKKSFKHTYKDSNYKMFKRSPLVNDEVNRLAIQFIEYGAVGKNKVTDFLSLTYYLGIPSENKKLYSTEIQEAYARLDRSIGQLLRSLDKKLPNKNVYVILMGTGYFQFEDENQNEKRIFYSDRCTALLNMYLMAIYGQQNWVSGFSDGHIFLNRKLIENKKLSLSEIQEIAADFVREFSGVQEVVTSNGIAKGYTSEEGLKLKRGSHHLNRGDLILKLQPGWNSSEREGIRQTYWNKIAVESPLFIYGPNIKPSKISYEIDARRIAPTISRILRIRAPNACIQNPLPEIVQ